MLKFMVVHKTSISNKLRGKKVIIILMKMINITPTMNLSSPNELVKREKCGAV